MEISPPQKSPATPKRRTRRRLVQSTLFPQKQPENADNGDLKKESGEEENHDPDEDEEFTGSQSKKKRKPAAKKTPPIKAPKKKANSTPKKNNTPKKNCTPKKNAKNVEVEEASGPLVIPDLRLEAKMRAEEMSRIYEGKKLNPFFSSWKVGKKNQEETDVEGSSSFMGSKDKYAMGAPIHVFERTQDNAEPLDWTNWTFCDETNMKSGPDLQCTPSSIFEGTVECLSFDNFSGSSELCKSSSQNAALLDESHVQQECAHETSSIVSHFFGKELLRCSQYSNKAEEYENGMFSEHAGYMKKSDRDQQNIFLEERLLSNNLGCCDLPKNSLWTYKYQPKKAREVCGNDESVGFLSEWLHSWFERDLQINEDPTGDGNDYRCSQSDLESEDEETTLKKRNVLLVTGPIGSGKSAAIYACAKEQEVKVMELSASECRTGALVKQRFGEAFKSRHLRRSVANAVGSQKKLVIKPDSVEANGTTGPEYDDDDIVELIPISDEDSHDATGTSVTFAFKEDTCKDKLVILFEDVDITFLEDRGFIAAIQEIAKTANGPIILTSNSPNPVLPDNFDRIQVQFNLPSSAELHSLAYMVCAAEKANIHPYLLGKFIECCRGDIRKTIMHLQFWSQGRNYIKDTKMMRKTYGSLLFDVEAVHRMLPKLLPWDLPSQLSDLVEQEITKCISMMEAGPKPMEVDDNLERQCRLDMCYDEMDKKVAMLNRNGSTHDSSEYTCQTDTAQEFSNDTGTSFLFPWQRARRMYGVVMSSDSEDEFINNGYPTGVDKDIYNGGIGVNSLPEELLFSGVATIDNGHYYCSETADELQMSEMFNLADISCVPESSFVSETEMDNGTDFLSQTMSTGHFATTMNDVFLGEELPVADDHGIDLLSQTMTSGHFATTIKELSFGKELHVEDNNGIDLLSQTVSPGPVANTKNLVSIDEDLPVEDNNLGDKLPRNFVKFENNCEAILEYSYQLDDSQHLGTVARASQLMDECSRMDFCKASKFIQEQKFAPITNLIQESWNKLRGSNIDLRQYVPSEKDTSQIVMLAYRMSNLISETDVLFSKCQSLISDFLEPSMISLEESDAYSGDERLLLASTIAQHGFCFYANAISSVGSNVGSLRMVDLASEMLADTTNMMALGKLIGQDTKTSNTSYAGRNSEMTLPDVSTSEIKPLVFNAVQSIVPSRFSLALRNNTYLEYLSSLRHISRSEASRLSKDVETTTTRRRRRKRVAPHYLSSGTRMMSPEHLSLLDQHNLCGKSTASSN